MAPSEIELPGSSMHPSDLPIERSNWPAKLSECRPEEIKPPTTNFSVTIFIFVFGTIWEYQKAVVELSFETQGPLSHHVKRNPLLRPLRSELCPC